MIDYSQIDPNGNYVIGYGFNDELYIHSLVKVEGSLHRDITYDGDSQLVISFELFREQLERMDLDDGSIDSSIYAEVKLVYDFIMLRYKLTTFLDK